MDSFADIISRWPSAHHLARAVGVRHVTARTWKRRDNIPPAYWLAVVDAAEAAGIEGVTLDLLARLSARSTSENEAV